jgi:hypothetical protein
MKKESKIYTQDDYFNDEFPKEKPKQHVELINDNIEEFDKAIELFKQETLEEKLDKIVSKEPSKFWEESDERFKNKETLEEVAEKYVDDFEYGIAHPRRVCKNAFINGAKWQQEKICDSEVLQRIRASKSDAEARRIIKTI